MKHPSGRFAGAWSAPIGTRVAASGNVGAKLIVSVLLDAALAGKRVDFEPILTVFHVKQSAFASIPRTPGTGDRSGRLQESARPAPGWMADTR